MRTKTTPWNKSYKRDEFVKEIRKAAPRGFGRSEGQREAMKAAQKHFRINPEFKKPQELPEDWKAIGKSRKKAMDAFEEMQRKRELKEVWE